MIFYSPSHLSIVTPILEPQNSKCGSLRCKSVVERRHSFHLLLGELFFPPEIALEYLITKGCKVKMALNTSVKTRPPSSQTRSLPNTCSFQGRPNKSSSLDLLGLIYSWACVRITQEFPMLRKQIYFLFRLTYVKRTCCKCCKKDSWILGYEFMNVSFSLCLFCTFLMAFSVA